MKQSLFLITVLISSYFFPASAQTRVYTGTITDLGEIEMHLCVHNKQTYGYYFFKGKDKIISFHSRLAGRVIQLIEGDEVAASRYFDGTFTDSTLTGAWTDLPTSKSYPYSLKLTKWDTVNKEKAKHNGTYEYKTPILHNTLNMVYIDNNYLYFYLTIGSKACTGYLHGIANVQAAGGALYSDPQCLQISFANTGKTITVAEKKCINYHGPTCKFDGIYKLKK